VKRALVCLVLAVACGSSASPDAFLDSVVGVEANGCSLVAALGSGAIVDEQRVMTSAHTVAGAQEIVVIDFDGDRHPAVLVGFDPDKDLAVLSVAGLDGDPLAKRRASGGESGWVLAWDPDEGAHANPMTVTKRILVSIEDIYVADIVERHAIEIDADVTSGDSGAAVVTQTGEMVGVVYARSRSRPAGFALDEQEIAAALSTAGATAVDSGPCT
jgi:S1-C subfamily serine protease